jgi:hypothetical protein
MKTLLSIASVLVLSAAPAFAGQGQVSHQSLTKMGLSGMQLMSDDQGMQVRGLSIAVAAGGSIATISGEGGHATSVNGYFAAGNHSADGNNVSFAADGTSHTVSATVGGHTASVTTTTVNFVAAGGASSAHAY